MIELSLELIWSKIVLKPLDKFVCAFKSISSSAWPAAVVF